MGEGISQKLIKKRKEEKKKVSVINMLPIYKESIIVQYRRRTSYPVGGTTLPVRSFSQVKRLPIAHFSIYRYDIYTPLCRLLNRQDTEDLIPSLSVSGALMTKVRLNPLPQYTSIS